MKTKKQNRASNAVLPAATFDFFFVSVFLAFAAGLAGRVCGKRCMGTCAQHLH
jgi:hypothetical protein